jgi:hypothetical protein
VVDEMADYVELDAGEDGAHPAGEPRVNERTGELRWASLGWSKSPNPSVHCPPGAHGHLDTTCAILVRVAL